MKIPKGIYLGQEMLVALVSVIKNGYRYYEQLTFSAAIYISRKLGYRHCKWVPKGTEFWY